VHNESDSEEWAAAFQNKYAGEHIAKYAAEDRDANASTSGEAVKANARECRTLAELDAWREAQLAQTRFVPGAYRAFARGSIQREYSANADRITKEQEETRNETAGDEHLSNGTLTSSNPSVAQQVEATPTPETENETSSVAAQPRDATHNGTAPLDEAVALADNSEIHGRFMRPLLVSALLAAVVSALAMRVVKRNTVSTMPAGYSRLVEEP